MWGPEQEKEFLKLKKVIASAPILAPYLLEAETVLSTDASSYGLGVAILQRHEEVWRPVAYASISLTAAKTKYVQIEKEALDICWACSKFHYFLAGKLSMVETDHKLLVSNLEEKELAKLPVRVQHFRLGMMVYTYTTCYTPGEKLVLANALSRASLQTTSGKQGELVDSHIVYQL